MSAYLDRSQGITFVYSNIFEMYKTAKDAKIDAPFVAEHSRVIKGEAQVGTAHTAAQNAERAGRTGDQNAQQGKVLKGLSVEQGQIKVEEFQARELTPNQDERPFPVPMGVREAEEKAKRANMRPIANLQKNLSELTDAHEKLRFLLQELESLTKKK